MKNISKNTLGAVKKLIAIAAVAAGLIAASGANAATPVANWCTATYQMPNDVTLMAAGSDSAIVNVLGSPNITVVKYAMNERTGIDGTGSIGGISGDTILYTIIWANAGEASADSVTINDYMPSGLTYVAASLTDTAANATGTSSKAGNFIQWVNNAGTDVPGTIPGPAADGIIKFRATIN